MDVRFIATDEFSTKAKQALGEGGYRTLKRRLLFNPFAGRMVHEDARGVDLELKYKPENVEYFVDYGYDFDTETLIARDFRSGNEGRKQITLRRLFEGAREALDRLPDIEKKVAAAEKLANRILDWLGLGGD